MKKLFEKANPHKTNRESKLQSFHINLLGFDFVKIFRSMSTNITPHGRGSISGSIADFPVNRCKHHGMFYFSDSIRSRHFSLSQVGNLIFNVGYVTFGYVFRFTNKSYTYRPTKSRGRRDWVLPYNFSLFSINNNYESQRIKLALINTNVTVSVVLKVLLELCLLPPVIPLF